MRDDQHDHDPEVPAEPDGQQAPGADQENDEKEPPRQWRNTIRELSEGFDKATGRPAPHSQARGLRGH
ncbi:hypothetical protein [Streptomyces sp. JHA26]|uniref:hypothetical protein n=1 Tax=Streptomyces sp. JHA26 TaxID=1917143 RepID=UPI00098B63EE|nr:hypothetical protein [Streptomyces sp. JHA26]